MYLLVFAEKNGRNDQIRVFWSYVVKRLNIYESLQAKIKKIRKIFVGSYF
jgi:hypothetical protein